MTRYPNAADRFDYRCDDCGARIPPFQGLYWFVRDRTVDDGDASVEVPYCPKCGGETIVKHSR